MNYSFVFNVIGYVILFILASLSLMVILVSIVQMLVLTTILTPIESNLVTTTENIVYRSLGKNIINCDCSVEK